MRAAIFDVDGVLTDGSLHLSEHGELFKSFSVLDGQGLKLLLLGGITPLIVSGRDSPALRRRVADLGLAHGVYGASDKPAAVEPLLASLACGWADVAVMGDDWPDLPLFARAGFRCAPPHAHVEVRSRADHVTEAPAGRGAAREFCDLLLMAAGHYARLLSAHGQTLDSR
jgi:3-deoxy-D-manno-octulosonate 8-phosphate phosphatase (KDO 8-P phosphatase)